MTVDGVVVATRTAASTFSLAMPRRADLLCYDTASARGFCLSPRAPHYVELSNADPERTWTSVVAGVFGPGPLSGLAFYSSTTGRLQLCSVDPVGPLKPVGHSTVGAGWTTVVAGDFDRDGHSDLLFYNPAGGKAQIWSSDGNGGEAQQTGHGYLGAGWTVLASGDFNRDGHDDVLFYNGTDGRDMSCGPAASTLP